MAKKRGLSDNQQDCKKKRSSNSNPMTPTTLGSTKPERSMLNDGLLSLYKKELIDKKDTPTIKNEISEHKAKESDAESFKTPARVRRRAKHAVLTPTHSTVTFKDIGGMGDIIQKIPGMFYHYYDPSLYREQGIEPSRGILLHGPPGCGKTQFARAIAGELDLPILEVAATAFVCGISGESESKIRDAFDAAFASGRCILFIDEIDAICSKRETTDNGMMKRMVSQMIKCFDELCIKDPDANVTVIAATNLPDSIDPALRRGMRFEQELAIGIPNEESRLKILKVLFKKLKIVPDFDYQWLAHNTPGYVGVDLHTLVRETFKTVLNRIIKEVFESGDNEKNEEITSDIPSEDDITWLKTLDFSEVSKKFKLTVDDFKVSLQECVPSSQREGFADIPDTTWDDVGALEDIKKQLRSTILWPVKYHKLYADNNLSSIKGILLYGPKGCGKTLLAKAIANECSINFLSVRGPELLSMYVGESEKAIRKCFERARNSAPCVIFFDEFDALCSPRSSTKENAPIERVVNQLLTETCGVQERKQVFLVAATNRIEKIDSAMLRPGRLEKILYVGLPTPDGRVDILKSQTKNKTCPKIEDDLALETIALDERCNDYSGADLAYLVREATSKAVEEMIDSSFTQSDVILCWRHFDEALNTVKPSFSEQDRKYFQRIALNYTRNQ